MSVTPPSPPAPTTVEGKRRLLASLLAKRAGERTAGPVSFAQQRLWVLDQLAPASGGYHVPILLRTAVAPDVAALRAALGEVVRRHQVLRTVFAAGEGTPVQHVRPPFEPIVEQWNVGEGPDPAAQTERRLRGWMQQPFDLAAGPLLRTAVIRLPEGQYLIALTVHQIVCDGWSVVTLFTELDALYRQFRTGLDAGLAPMAVQYLDYADWQRSQLTADRLDTLAGYWRDRLDGAPGLLQLPMDHARPTGYRLDGGSQETLLPAGTAAAVHGLATAERTTPFVLLLACFAALMSRYSGQRDIVVGVPVAGQHRKEFEGLVGFFVNTLVMRVQVDGDPSLRELLRRARQEAMGAFAHQDMPFEKLVVELQPDRYPAVTPVFQVLFNYQVASDERVRLPSLDAELVPFDSGLVRFDLELNLFARAGQVGGTWVYNKELFAPSTIARMSHLFERLVAGAVAAPDSPLSTVQLLDGTDLDEQRDIGGRIGLPAGSPERAFAEWARRTPEAIAVRLAGTAVSYADLDAAATAAADALLAAGVRPGAPVAIPAGPDPVPRVVGLLAVLRVGATPIDASTAFGAFQLVTGPGGWRALPPAGIPVADALARRVQLRDRDLTLPAGAVVVVTPSPADLDELLWPLTHGATLALAAEPAAVRAMLDTGPVHTLRTAPGLLHHLLADVEHGGEWRPQLERVLCAAEPVGAVERRFLRVLPCTELWTVYRLAATGDLARRRCRGDVPAGHDVVGEVVPGATVRVLDAHGRPQPIGVAGAVHVAVSDTPCAGMVDPFAPEGSRHLLDTGDLGRFREDGRLELLGRVAEQVHQHQVRIPRGEVEAVLADHEVVGDSRVEARVDQDTGALHVVAFVVPEPGASAPSPRQLTASLRAHCQRLLPAVLVPAEFVPLPEFPLAADSTVDRAALACPAPDPEQAEPETGMAGEPSDPAQRALVDIWRAALGVPAVGVHDNFFALGGHSLLAVQVMTQVRRKLGVDLPVSVLFRYRTVADLAARIAMLRSGGRKAGWALVPIQTGPAEPVLALVHPAGGSVSCYASLATALADRTVHAFETWSPAPSLVEQAQGYLDELEARDGKPPALAGWAPGGVVAFEMALQRVRASGPATPVVLIDSCLYAGDPASPDTHRYLLESFLRDLTADLDLDAPALPPGADHMPVRRLFADVLDGLGERAPAGLDLDEVVLRHDVYRRNVLNLAGYRPAGPYPGEVHLVQASGSPQDADAWRPYAPRLVVHRVDGDRYSIMRNPCITVIARIIDAVLASGAPQRQRGWAA